MLELRRYGQPPFTVAVLHGGPGAPGYMAPVARELSAQWGVLEPLQSATSVEGQIDDLRAVLEEEAGLPVTLIGASWGAWLGYAVAAHHPALVKRLIMVGSGPFEARYAAQITEARMSRLSEEERREMASLEERMADPTVHEKDALLARLGALCSRTDGYDPIEASSEVIEHQQELYRRVWGEAAEMRGDGRLLEMGREIRCPVVAIHGDYDPHPAEGVREPLSRVLRDFRFVLLSKCGHEPWMERQARDEFYRILRQELGR